MAKLTMQRDAADNVYLHKDFHGALSNGIEYLHTRYGEEAVREYLRQFTRAYYAPLMADIQARGLLAIKEHMEHLYRIEGGDVRITLDEDALTVEVEACPAVAHMRASEYTVARLWRETTRTVNETLCEGTLFVAEMVDYDDETGRSVQRFHRRKA